MPRRELQALALHQQGLDCASAFGSSRAGVLRAIEHLGYVQIDSIAVVERAHHHVLWSRLPDYQPGYVQDLIDGGAIFEYWAHAAALLPMRDYRFALYRMETARRHGHQWFKANQALCRRLLAQIRDRGASRLRDLASGSGKGGWWQWSEEKRALEQLFMQGELMVLRREGMEKVYDLRERVLPPSADCRLPDAQTYAQWLLDGYLRAHGVISLGQLLHLQRDKAVQSALRDLLHAYLAEKRLLAVPEFRQTYRLAAVPAAGHSPRLHILSPFDNLLIYRPRLQELFGFDYRLECYLPAAKRRYGYFSLPVLMDGRFAARIDCKALRREQTLLMQACHIEAGVEREPLAAALAPALSTFAAFNGCTQIADDTRLTEDRR